MLLLFELNFGCGADLQHGNAAAELGETLLELLTVVVGIGVVDLGLDLVDATLDVVFVASTLDDGCLVLGDDDLLGGAEQIHRGVLKLEADFFADDLTTGEDGDVLQHGLAALAEARSLDGCRLERATNLVDDERGESLALDIFGQDEQWASALHDLLEHGEHVAHRRDLRGHDEDVWIVE
ncbi:unannotated protein [freshwater metagenome]|uniref:Unannotated protein n=1 Tax=freshwater metagenome TaxID=449393 RepID=A0A6J6PCB6_9ZZZZ